MSFILLSSSLFKITLGEHKEKKYFHLHIDFLHNGVNGLLYVHH